MEHEIFVSGIGGQGIQIVAKMLAVAATSENRHVMLNGVYGGEMRGGKSLATIVVGNDRLRALPVTASAGAAVVLHSNFWSTPSERLRSDALIVADSQIAGQLSCSPGQTLVEIPATQLARQIGNPLVTGMVLMSAFNAITGLVDAASLHEAMVSLVPPYRAQHVAANASALAEGVRAGSRYSHPIELGPRPERVAA